MRSRYPRNEAGQASILEAVITLLAVFMLALPLYEYGRMANDGILAASAAEDAVKAAAADPSMTTQDAMEFIRAEYADIASVSTVELSVSPTRQTTYDHYLNVEGGGHTARASKATWKEVDVRVTVQRDFLFPVGKFIGVPDSSGYLISKTATATTDQTIKSGAW